MKILKKKINIIDKNIGDSFYLKHSYIEDKQTWTEATINDKEEFTSPLGSRMIKYKVCICCECCGNKHFTFTFELLCYKSELYKDHYSSHNNVFLIKT